MYFLVIVPRVTSRLVVISFLLSRFLLRVLNTRINIRHFIGRHSAAVHVRRSFLQSLKVNRQTFYWKKI